MLSSVCLFLTLSIQPGAAKSSGLEVFAVAPDSIAAKNGIRPGDIILSWGDRVLETPVGFRLAVRNTVSRGVVPVKFRHKTFAVNPDELGEGPKSVEKFGILVQPALTGKTKEMLAEAMKLAEKEPAKAGMLAMEAGKAEITAGNIAPGVSLVLAGSRTIPDFNRHQTVLDHMALLTRMQDRAARAELLFARYWTDPLHGADPKRPEIRKWFYEFLGELKAGGYVLSLAAQTGMVMGGTPFHYINEEEAERFRSGLAGLRGVAATDLMKAAIFRNIGWRTNYGSGGTTEATFYGARAYLESARIYEANKGKELDLRVVTDNDWSLVKNNWGQPWNGSWLAPAELLAAGSYALAAQSFLYAFDYSQAEQAAVKAVTLYNSVPKERRQDRIYPDVEEFAPWVLALCADFRGDLDMVKTWQQELQSIGFRMRTADDIDLLVLKATDKPKALELANGLVRRNRWNSKSSDLDVAVPLLVADLLAKGKPGEAEALARKGVDMWAFPKIGAWVPQGQILLGRVLAAQGKTQEARTAFKAAIDASRGLPRANPFVIRALSWWGSMASGEDSNVEAEKALQEAVDLSLIFASNAKGELSRQFAASVVAEASRHLVQHQVKNGRVLQAINTLEQARGRALASLIASSRADQTTPEWKAYLEAASSFEKAENALITTERQVEELRAASEAAKNSADSLKALGISGDFVSGPGESAAEAARLAGTLSSLRQQAAQARIRLDQASGSALSSLGAAPRQITQENLNKLLANGRAFVAYAATADSLVAIAGSGDGALHAEKVNLAGKALDVVVSEFVQLASDPKAPVGELEKAADALGRTLFPGRILQIASKAKSLLIQPEGALWGLPFSALRLPGQGGRQEWLGQSKPLAFAQSFAILSQIAEVSRNGSGAVVVGDPIFSRAEVAARAEGNEELSRVWGGNTPPPPLPGTQDEAKFVAALYQAAPLLQEDATEANLRQRIEKARVVHLATHGYLNSNFPLSSGVLLTPPAQAGESSNDGALQAAEISRRLRLNADLVVLSACETGRGRFLQGEGVQGLVQSFLMSGARSVVASQWKVADKSTADLMKAFHARFSKGAGAPESLQAAMAELAKTKPHPYYWAPFSAYGSL